MRCSHRIQLIEVIQVAQRLAQVEKLGPPDPQQIRPERLQDFKVMLLVDYGFSRLVQVCDPVSCQAFAQLFPAPRVSVPEAALE